MPCSPILCKRGGKERPRCSVHISLALSLLHKDILWLVPFSFNVFYSSIFCACISICLSFNRTYARYGDGQACCARLRSPPLHQWLFMLFPYWDSLYPILFNSVFSVVLLMIRTSPIILTMFMLSSPFFILFVRSVLLTVDKLVLFSPPSLSRHSHQ